MVFVNGASITGDWGLLVTVTLKPHDHLFNGLAYYLHLTDGRSDSKSFPCLSQEHSAGKCGYRSRPEIFKSRAFKPLSFTSTLALGNEASLIYWVL